MRRFLTSATIVLALAGCTTILGIDGEFDDQASGGASGSGGADAGTGAAGTGGVAGAENCLNGVDDDNNAQVDCADPACEDRFVCEPAAPAGFMGPAVLWTGTGNQTAPPCSDPMLDQLPLFEGLTAAGADCGSVGCQCTEASSPTCLGLVKYQSGTCTTAGSYTPLSAGCTNVTVTVPSFANHVTGISGSLTCTPSAKGSPTLPPQSVAARYALCTAGSPGAGCSGDLCVPKTDANYAKRCVFQKGNVACPGAYPNVLNLFSSVNDTRGCSACTCDDSAPCTVSVEEYPTSGCAGSGNAVPKGGSCLQISGPPAQRSVQVTATAPSCIPGGGAPMGAISAAGPVTVCCQ